MELVGRTVWFFQDGYRSGKVVRVKAGKRVGLQRLRVRLAGMNEKGRLGHYGRVVTVWPRSLHGPGCGVMVRGNVVSL